MKRYFWIILAVFLICLFIVACWFGPSVFLAEKEKSIFPSGLRPVVTPTGPPAGGPTPTPTLTSQQQAEARNKKYGPCRYVPILMYHHVLPAAEAKKIQAGQLNVPPEIFREQMDYLAQKGYQIIDLAEMLVGLRNNTLPPKPVVLTFDDGYRDFYDNAYPILREKNFKATVFVISQYVGGEHYLNWGQIKEMADSGLVLVGDHTLSHPALASKSEEEERNQIVSAKNIIEERIEKKVEFFAYPYGSTNSTAKKILKETGFAGAVLSTNFAPQCLGLPYDFSRMRIGATSLFRYGL